MTSPKKSIKKSPLNDPSEQDGNNEISKDKIRNKNSYDDDDDFDLPLDDLDTFDDFNSDDDDDDY